MVEDGAVRVDGCYGGYAKRIKNLVQAFKRQKTAVIA